MLTDYVLRKTLGEDKTVVNGGLTVRANGGRGVFSRDLLHRFMLLPLYQLQYKVPQSECQHLRCLRKNAVPETGTAGITGEGKPDILLRNGRQWLRRLRR